MKLSESRSFQFWLPKRDISQSPRHVVDESHAMATMLDAIALWKFREANGEDCSSMRYLHICRLAGVSNGNNNNKENSIRVRLPVDSFKTN